MGISPTGMRWLALRAIDAEIASRYGVDSLETPQDEAITFAYMVGDQQVNTKYRTLADKRFWMDAGGEVVAWNFNTLTDRELCKSQPLIITEGEMDALSVIQAGFPHVISAPNGAPSSEIKDDEGAQYAWLRNIAKMIDHKEIILAVDNDEAGARLRRDLQLRLGAARCRWVKYPDDCKDMNDVLQAYGEKRIVELITQAPWVQLDGLYALDDLPAEPDRPVYPTGLDGMDPHWKIRRGEFTVVTGIPGFGKTEMLRNVYCSIADNLGWRIAIASFEESARANLVQSLRRWHLGRPAKEATQADLDRADAWIRKHFVFVVPHQEKEANLLWLLSCLKGAVTRYGARFVAIDPWNELEHDKPQDMTMTEYTGHAIRSIKTFARNYDCHVAIVAHPTKSVAGKDRDGNVTLYDIENSAHWANKCDVGVVVHRDFKSNLTRISVKKVRFQQDVGKPGSIWYSFNSYSGQFHIAVAPDELVQKGKR